MIEGVTDGFLNSVLARIAMRNAANQLVFCGADRRTAYQSDLLGFLVGFLLGFLELDEAFDTFILKVK